MLWTCPVIMASDWRSRQGASSGFRIPGELEAQEEMESTGRRPDRADILRPIRSLGTAQHSKTQCWDSQRPTPGFHVPGASQGSHMPLVSTEL